MSSNTNTIQTYLKSIPATPEEIYGWFSVHRLTYEEQKKWGFPVYDAKHPHQVNLFAHFIFSNSSDKDDQVCRCGKPLSLREKNWYEDDKGCSYHWGKRTFCHGPENGLFSCCKGVSEEDGCVHHKYHASSYKPLEHSAFSWTFRKKQWSLNSANVLALDSEMVYTTAGLEVARVSLVSIRGDVVYDSFVKPGNLILDYNTPFSGVKPEDLDGATPTLKDVQQFLLQLLNVDTILVGHGLENDLIGLHLVHTNVVDTSLIFAHEKGFPYRHSLKTLAAKHLDKVIHSDSNGHNSVEDAKICMALMLSKLYLQKSSPYCRVAETSKKIQPYRPANKSNGCICKDSNMHLSPKGFLLKTTPWMDGQLFIIPKIVRMQFPICFCLPPPPVLPGILRMCPPELSPKRK